MVDVEMDEVTVPSRCPRCGEDEDGCYCRYETEELDE
jgi:predicted Zn-ribbon and HTH transcriptional regulator